MCAGFSLKGFECLLSMVSILYGVFSLWRLSFIMQYTLNLLHLLVSIKETVLRDNCHLDPAMMLWFSCGQTFLNWFQIRFKFSTRKSVAQVALPNLLAHKTELGVRCPIS